MAPSKQGGKQLKGKEIVVELGKENPTRLVSELDEGGMSSSSNSEEFALIRKGQYQLLVVVSNLSAKFDLLLKSRMDGLENCEGIGTNQIRVPANSVEVDDPRRGINRDHQQEEPLTSLSSRRHRDESMQSFFRDCLQKEPWQGNRHRPQQEFLRPWDNMSNGVFRGNAHDHVQGHSRSNQLREAMISAGGRQQMGFSRPSMERVRHNGQEEFRNAVPNEDRLQGSKISCVHDHVQLQQQQQFQQQQHHFQQQQHLQQQQQQLQQQQPRQQQQQQLMSQLQSQSEQLSQQITLQQQGPQANPIPLQQRMQAPSNLLQAQSTIEQRKQYPFQVQRGPAGQLLRYKEVILLNDLIDCARPGEEIEDLFSAYKLTKEDKEEIEELAKDPRIGERIIKSIAPSIYDHEDIKTAIALAMFGEQEKNVKAKHRLRGDITVLLLGDPGTTKSQFLKYVEKTGQSVLIEPTSGNTSIGLAFRAAAKKGFKLDKLDFNFNGPGGFDLDRGFSKEKKSEKSNECGKDIYAGIPGCAKSALCKEILRSEEGLGDDRPVHSLMGDFIKGRNWQKVADERKKKPYAITLADKNAPNEEAWRQIENMCRSTQASAIPVIPDSEGSDSNPFSIDSKALPLLVSTLLEPLLKQEEDQDQDDGVWNLFVAGGICLGLIAKTVGDAVVTLVMPFVQANIVKPDWRSREAATFALGSVLEGPSIEKLQSLVQAGLDFLLNGMKDQNTHVKDTTAWTLSRIFEILHSPENDYANQLRRGIFEAYSGILQGLKSTKAELMVSHAAHLLQFIEAVFQEKGRDETVTKAAVAQVSSDGANETAKRPENEDHRWLAHIVYSENDANFWAFYKQLNEEAANLEWTKVKSYTLSGRKQQDRHEDEYPVVASASGHKLEGTSHAFSVNPQLLSAVAAHNRSLSATASEEKEHEPDSDDLQSSDDLQLRIQDHGFGNQLPETHEKPDPDDYPEAANVENREQGRVVEETHVNKQRAAQTSC